MFKLQHYTGACAAGDMRPLHAYKKAFCPCAAGAGRLCLMPVGTNNLSEKTENEM